MLNALLQWLLSTDETLGWSTDVVTLALLDRLQEQVQEFVKVTVQIERSFERL